MNGLKALLGGTLLAFTALAWAQVNVNTASPEELQALDGIGETKARAIVDYREANGGFASADELTAVDGVGAKTLESIRDQVTTGKE